MIKFSISFVHNCIASKKGTIMLKGVAQHTTPSQIREKITKAQKVEKGVYKDVIAHDVVKYGIIPELVGRIPVIVPLDDLDKDALVRIRGQKADDFYFSRADGIIRTYEPYSLNEQLLALEKELFD